ncbi:MAG: aspartyl protease [Deltaproteobacteria bacterium]|nr:MAG: aspartyl protease [Deltaproteobacteria bacterium]
MGIVYVKGTVRHGNKEREAEFLVDSGATYSLLRKEIWQELRLEPKREIELVLADGTRIRRFLSECYIKLPFDSAEGHTPVILGEEGDDENLLGIVTLEILGFIIDPIKREIRPMRILLKPILKGRR